MDDTRENTYAGGYDGLTLRRLFRILEQKTGFLQRDMTGREPFKLMHVPNICSLLGL